MKTGMQNTSKFRQLVVHILGFCNGEGHHTMKRLSKVGSMLAHRRRRWASIDPTLAGYLLLCETLSAYG